MTDYTEVVERAKEVLVKVASDKWVIETSVIQKIAAAVVKMAEEDHKARLLLFLTHPCVGKYGDDGEMQCNACMIDFKRDALDQISEKITACGMREYKRIQELETIVLPVAEEKLGKQRERIKELEAQLALTDAQLRAKELSLLRCAEFITGLGYIGELNEQAGQKWAKKLATARKLIERALDQNWDGWAEEAEQFLKEAAR